MFGYAAKAQMLLSVDDKEIGPALTGAESNLQSFSDKANTILAGITLAYLTKQIIDFGTAALNAYAEAQQAEKGLAAVLRSTGQAAGFSKEQLAAYAEELEDLTNISDETIMGVEKLLATFTNIKGDNFKLATKAALDMGAVLGSTESAAIQLGKALNDPAQGMSALSRSGVSFTESQKEMVKYLQETGDIVGAQKIILQELAVEFGGAADSTGTFQDQVDAMNVKLGRLQEDIGGLIAASLVEFAPSMDSAAASLAAVLGPAIGVAMALADVTAQMLGAANAAGELDRAEFANTVSEWKIGVQSLFSETLLEAKTFGEAVDGMFNTIWESLGAGLGVEADVKKVEERARKLAEADIAAKKEAEQREKEEKAKREAEAKFKAKERERELKELEAHAAARQAAAKAQADAERAAREKEQEDKRKAREAEAAEQKKQREAEAEAARAKREKEQADREAAREAERAEKDKLAEEERKAREKEQAEREAWDAEERARLKAQADYERSLGRDGLESLQKRIQDSAMIIKGGGNLGWSWTSAISQKPGKQEKQANLGVDNDPGKAIAFSPIFGAGIAGGNNWVNAIAGAIAPPEALNSPEQMGFANQFGPTYAKPSSLKVEANVNNEPVVEAIHELTGVVRIAQQVGG